jgi:hypothetical protein
VSEIGGTKLDKFKIKKREMLEDIEEEPEIT